MKERRLNFVKTFRQDGNVAFLVYNKKDEMIAIIDKGMVGAHYHWLFMPENDMQFSAGCMDEIREFIKNPTKYVENYPDNVDLSIITHEK